MIRGSSWRYFDFWLLGAVAALVIFGVTMIRSAVAGNIELTVDTPLVNRQIIFALIGFAVALGVASIDYHLWGSISRTLYIGIVVVLISLNVIGETLFGSARWFRTTVVNIQPSEFSKIVLILVLAYFFARRMQVMDDPKWILQSLLLTMGITLWIILQPNLSTSIVMIVLWMSLLWIAGAKIKHLLVYAGTGLLLLIITFPVLVQTQIIQDYQLRRINNFIFPDPTTRFGDIYNIQQALISIGSGGWFGEGYGHGPQVQLRFLKVRWSDFIFSALAHEFGFIGTAIVLIILAFVVYRCLRAASMARDSYGALIAYGVAILIAFQALVNIGVNLNMMPATGLTLPFLSYGGSSLVANLIAIGLVESVIMRHKALEL
jgi:rod shape determining protein RodA